MQVAIFPVLMVGAIYLLLWRPQQRRIAAVRQLQSKIQEGDDVLTTSGIYGRITRLGESDAEIEIAPGTVIHVARGAIGQRIEAETFPHSGPNSGPPQAGPQAGPPQAGPHSGGPHDGETGAD